MNYLNTTDEFRAKASFFFRAHFYSIIYTFYRTDTTSLAFIRVDIIKAFINLENCRVRTADIADSALKTSVPVPLRPFISPFRSAEDLMPDSTSYSIVFN